MRAGDEETAQLMSPRLPIYRPPQARAWHLAASRWRATPFPRWESSCTLIAACLSLRACCCAPVAAHLPLRPVAAPPHWHSAAAIFAQCADRKSSSRPGAPAAPNSHHASGAHASHSKRLMPKEGMGGGPQP